jgi:hypothetical protein
VRAREETPAARPPVSLHGPSAHRRSSGESLRVTAGVAAAEEAAEAQEWSVERPEFTEPFQRHRKEVEARSPNPAAGRSGLMNTGVTDVKLDETDNPGATE